MTMKKYFQVMFMVNLKVTDGVSKLLQNSISYFNTPWFIFYQAQFVLVIFFYHFCYVFETITEIFFIILLL